MGKLDAFDITSYAYKTVKKTPIYTDVLIPKDVPEGPRPILIRLHGGFLITGSRKQEDWFGLWVSQLASTNGAIFIQPDYRLMPEATGVEILSDIDDFYTWFTTELPGVLAKVAPKVTADYDRVVVVGESAGGYLSLQFALDHKDKLRAAISIYPMTDMRDPWYTQDFPKKMAGAPLHPESLIDEYLAAKTEDTVVVDDISEKRVGLMFSIVQHGKFLDLIGPQDERLFLDDRVKKGETFPPLFVIHGETDSSVPFQGTDDLLKLAKEKDAGLEVCFTHPDVEHGFDSNYSLDNPLLAEGVKFVVEKWLR
ncbi:Alpha/Beta hydrolase protein [Myxozyma melibiosi]|uniref:Alpha/Beta hydrolase protein n=1 Tax=Myxozyma melibiosi TaxID=54550 RepID=A0ABR1F975_9ASCO